MCLLLHTTHSNNAEVTTPLVTKITLWLANSFHHITPKPIACRENLDSASTNAIDVLKQATLRHKKSTREVEKEKHDVGLS